MGMWSSRRKREDEAIPFAKNMHRRSVESERKYDIAIRMSAEAKSNGKDQ